MATMDAQAIFDNFHTHAKGTPGLSAAALTARQLAAKYQDRAMTTQQMIDTIQSGWKGSAAEAASRGLAPLAENALTNHQQLGTGQDIVSRQMESFHAAVSQVQPVPAGPSMTDIIATTAGGLGAPTVLDQVTHRQAVQQSNVDAYHRYVGASQYNTTNVPTLNTLDTTNAPVSVAPPSAPPVSAERVSAPQGGVQSSHIAGGASRGAPTLNRSGSIPGTASKAMPPPGVSGVGGVGAVSGNPVATGSTTTSGASAVASPPVGPPLTSSPVPVGSPGGSGPMGNVPVPVEPVVPIGGVPGGEPLPGPGGLRSLPPSTTVRGGGVGSGGPRSGSGASPGEGGGPGVGVRGGSGAWGEAAPATGGARSGAGAPVVGGLGSGASEGGVPEGERPRAGAAAGAAAEEEAMAAGRGATGRPATSGAASPMLGERGGKGSEDVEHTRRYGLDEEGEARFGIDEKTAPPVIGESTAEREQRQAEQTSRRHRDR